MSFKARGEDLTIPQSLAALGPLGGHKCVILWQRMHEAILTRIPVATKAMLLPTNKILMWIRGAANQKSTCIKKRRSYMEAEE